MPAPVRPAKWRAQWPPVSQTPPLSAVQIDSQGALRHNAATVGSRADGSACAWQELGRRAARGAKPARVHLIAVEGQGPALRPAWLRLGQKGLRSRRDGSAGGEEVAAAPHHRSLRSGGKGAAIRRGRRQPYGAARRGHTGARRRGADGAGERADRSVRWPAHTRGGRVQSVDDAEAEEPRLWRWGTCARLRPPWQ